LLQEYVPTFYTLETIIEHMLKGELRASVKAFSEIHFARMTEIPNRATPKTKMIRLAKEVKPVVPDINSPIRAASRADSTNTWAQIKPTISANPNPF
jgi:hypothetical protein